LRVGPNAAGIDRRIVRDRAVDDFHGVRAAGTEKTDAAAVGAAAVAADGAVDDPQRVSAKPQKEDSAAAGSIDIGCRVVAEGAIGKFAVREPQTDAAATACGIAGDVNTAQAQLGRAIDPAAGSTSGEVAAGNGHAADAHTNGEPADQVEHPKVRPRTGIASHGQPSRAAALDRDAARDVGQHGLQTDGLRRIEQRREQDLITAQRGSDGFAQCAVRGIAASVAAVRRGIDGVNGGLCVHGSAEHCHAECGTKGF